MWCLQFLDTTGIEKVEIVRNMSANRGLAQAQKAFCMGNALDIRNLKKHYGEVIAVDDVSFGVREGICFGLLGPNGAGKTTTVEIIEGVTPATSGEVYYQGQLAGKQFREEAGIQFQNTALQDYLSVYETLR